MTVKTAIEIVCPLCRAAPGKECTPRGNHGTRLYWAENDLWPAHLEREALLDPSTFSHGGGI